MKIIDTFKENFSKVIKDRMMVSILIAVFLSGLIFSIIFLTKTEVRDGLIYSRWTIFGSEHTYRDKWTYTLAMSGLGLIFAFLHSMLVAKVYLVSTKRMAAFFALFSVIVMILGVMIVSHAIGVVSV